MSATTTAAMIWSVAELLRGDYKQSDYGSVILPFILLRRLDSALAPTKQAVLDEYQKRKGASYDISPFLKKAAGQSFYTISRYDFATLLGDADNLKANLLDYINGFSPDARDIFERYKFAEQLEHLDQKNLLLLITRRFASFDLSPQAIHNDGMGLLFEDQIRRFAELSNETAGEHYTSREVIRLMVNLLFIADDQALNTPGTVRSIYDPTTGTGGMLAIAEEYIHAHNPRATLLLFGQELNEESYAICKADMLIKGYDVEHLVCGNTLSADGHCGRRFDYMLSNPPFGVDWKKVEKEVRQEHKQQGCAGRFGPGLPRISDGSLLFLMHLMSKMRPAHEGGSRIGIVLNGSPLFTGGAGSGESNIRKWIIENDYLEAIIALPSDMFYNTSICTYIWILTNHKTAARRGKIQLINATELFQKLRKSLGSKRKELSDDHIAEITRQYRAFAESEQSKIFDNDDFGYRTITVERPKRDAEGKIIYKKNQTPEVDTSLRDIENVPLKQDVEAYFAREVLPHVPDSWIDHSKTKLGYEIPFTRHFYRYTPPRPLEEIDADLKRLCGEIMELLMEITD